MLIAHTIALDPNNAQATYFKKACGVARFAYNWALAEWTRQYEAHQANPMLPRPSEAALRRQLNAIKREQFPWMLEVTKNATQMAIIQHGRAFQNFFAGRAKYPPFRKKGVHDRFTLTNDQFSVDGSRIRIPNLGWMRMRETLRFTGKRMLVTVSRVADRWHASIVVDTDDQSQLPKAENQGMAGVALGVSALATLSTGEAIPGSKAHTALLARLKRLSRSLSRKQKGSANRHKAKARLARLHARIGHIRQDALHKHTTDLTCRFHTIGIEDLKVCDMVKSRHLARSVADRGFFEFRRQLEYTAVSRGGVVVVAADRFFASSKTCAACGRRLDELPLSVREWTYPECGTIHERDVNAAINLKKVAESSVGGCQPFQRPADCSVTACGEKALACVARCA
jgi:putative transposase